MKVGTTPTRNIEYKRFYEIIRHKLKNQIALDSLNSSELSILQIIAGTTTDVADLAKTYLNALHTGTYVLEPEQWQTEGNRPAQISSTEEPDSIAINKEVTAEMEIYPNPSEGDFDIYVNSPNAGMASLRIINMQGMLVHDLQYFESNQFHKVHIYDLPEGLYSVLAEFEGKIIVRKLQISRR
jgi:hypothetical protein